MTIDPEDLLSCVDRMTDEQRARFCELVDPVHSDDMEADVEEIMAKVDSIMDPIKADLRAAYEASVGLNDPETRERIRAQIDAIPSPRVREPVPEPVPDMVARLLYRQMTGTKLNIEAVQPDPAMNDDIVQSLMARWARARAKWKRLFDEDTIPMMADPAGIKVDLEMIEELLYDKEIKGKDPARCSCGCGFIAGCGAGLIRVDRDFLCMEG